MKFTDILTEYRIPYITEGSEHCRPGWIQIDCPFCEKNRKKWHMGYNLEKSYVNCYKCGSHSLAQTLSAATGIPYPQSKKILSEIQTIIPEKEEHKGELKIPDMLEDLPSAHSRYLKRRGFDPEIIQKLWGIQGIGLAPKYSWRIWIPVFYRGEIVSWSTRSISDISQKKYINAPSSQEDIPINHLLYGEDFVRGDVIIVTEGFMDAWAIGPGAVSTMGVSYTQYQLLKMTKYKKVVVCFDNDRTTSTNAGQEKANKLCEDLSVYNIQVSNVILDAPDPAEAKPRELELLRRRFLK
jgi:DNA primase